MNNISPLRRLKDVESLILANLSELDIYQLPISEQKLINRIKNELIDAKLYWRDYESSETRQAQLEFAAELTKVLNQLQKNILKLSEEGIFSAIDVAQLSAQTNQIIEDIG